MTVIETLDLAPLIPLREALIQLSLDGWSIQDDGGIIRVNGSILTSPLEWAGVPDLEKYSSRRQAIGVRRGYTVSVDTVNGVWEITDLPEILPEQLFDSEQLADANKVWERDTSALAGLHLDWRVEIDLDPAKAVSGSDVAQLDVSWSASHIDGLFANDVVSALTRLIPKQGRRTFLALNGREEPAIFGAVTLATLQGLGDTRLSINPPNPPLPGETQIDSELTPSQTLLVSGRFEQWPIASKTLSFAASATTWGAIATSTTEGELEFFGYKKVRFSLPMTWTDEEIAGAIKLRSWAFGEISPDRILALRQIISLYNEPPFKFVEEILSSSETIYLGLRSTAVIEAVRDARDVETRTQQAVQQSSQASVDLAKSAGERVIAGLAAVGAAAIANVTQVLSFSVTTAILAFICGYFLAMLVLFLLIDFRAVGLPIKELDSETFVHSSFVRPDALAEMTSSPMVRGAKGLVLRARIAISSLYASIVIALLVTVCVRWAA
ncbi:MAG TPA: hypothetical protein VHZ81_15815 [Galbitalea sp.]|jgi:hypothetical protein|nr:hypothetical protein [Galbitalea sp.]